MAKLYFKYGTMDASKSASLLMAVHKYESQNKKILCLKSEIDSRDSFKFIESRALSYKHECILFSNQADLFAEISKLVDKNKEEYSCIFIDEAQFLTKEQVYQLTKVVDELNLSVLCYGLKNTFIQGELFEGSIALLYYSDSIEEIKSVCQFCNSKATMNLRIKDGKPIRYTKGKNLIVIGDVIKSNDYFISTCRKHYFNPEI